METDVGEGVLRACRKLLEVKINYSDYQLSIRVEHSHDWGLVYRGQVDQ